MAISDIAICNMAVIHCGRTAQPIASFTEKSTEARLCATWYDQCRREVLETLDWGFARARLALPLHSDPPPTEWNFRYQTPSDMIAIRTLWNPFYTTGGNVFYGFVQGYPFDDNSDAVPYQLETSLDGQSLTLLTNMPTATLMYTRDQVLPQMFTSLFVNALSHYLAAKIAFGITGTLAVEKKEQDEFLKAWNSAAASSANQGVSSPVRDAHTVRARL